MQYAVIIDAGSSGSRVRVYRWPDDSGGRELMSDVQRIKPTLKIRTGLAEIANDRDDVRDHIERLINNASGHIPPSRHNVTPIYFMATAGLYQNVEIFPQMSCFNQNILVLLPHVPANFLGANIFRINNNAFGQNNTFSPRTSFYINVQLIAWLTFIFFLMIL